MAKRGAPKKKAAPAKGLSKKKPATTTKTAVKGFEKLWQNKNNTAGAETIGEMIKDLEEKIELLKGYQRDGITGDFCAAPEDVVWLYHHDPEVAKKYGMHPVKECHCEECRSAHVH